MFFLRIWEKIKKARVKFSQGSVTVLAKKENYREARVKLANTQLSKLESAAATKKKTRRKLGQLPKITQSGAFWGKTSSNLGKKVLLLFQWLKMFFLNQQLK